ncbi:hypothetical protein VE03_02009 [Pseudogymnoascus sp. 23342-1-I1]|nr:hypothetical protein VE03_02009 [Pseudogymnoascus sp. 23342-1-I1]
MVSGVTMNPSTDRLIQGSWSSFEKPPFGIYGHENVEKSHTGTAKPQQLQRYWTRTLTMILVPPIITAWYAIIWTRLVLGVTNDDATKYRSFSGSLIYYSWFIIGVFGLPWARYGLLGVELAMLQTPFWKAPNLVATLMHSDTTWSGPSGWGKAIYYREFYRLWWLLALLSILPFIAFPMSGLVFELGDGYIKTSEYPMVTGRNTTTYNNRPISYSIAPDAWKMGLTPTVPGFGVVYTPPGVDRSEHSGLKKVPNTMPLTESIPDMFLAPQADVPVSGDTWGLRVKYNCSIVRDASELTILNEKPVSIHVANDARFNLRTPSGSTILIFNSSTDFGGYNMWSYSEIGWSIPLDVENTYEKGPSDDGVTYDISEPMVFEYALWQLQVHGYDEKPNETYPFNTTLGPTIKGMGSPYFLSENKSLVSNDSFSKIAQGKNFTLVKPNGVQVVLNASFTDLTDYFNPIYLTEYQLNGFPQEVIDIAQPVGVRCVVSSGAGTATLDGVTSTFSNYSRVDPDKNIQGQPGGVFGQLAQQSLYGTLFSDFFQTSHLPGPARFGQLGRYQGYIPSTGLLQSVLLAYGLDALDRIYGTPAGLTEEWQSTSLTSSEKGKILTIASMIPGRAPGFLVLGLFCLWSALSVTLGLVYGFRKRPSDRLDGYSMFTLGMEMADELKHNDEVMYGESFYGNKTLRKLPGR